MDSVVENLVLGGYSIDTPVAIVIQHRGRIKSCAARWGSIADIVREEGVIRCMMIVVGRVLGGDYELSKLYDKQFSHMFRDGVEADSNESLRRYFP